MRWGHSIIALLGGLIIGLGVPLVIQELPLGAPAVQQLSTQVKQSTYEPPAPALQSYRFVLRDGKLAVVEKERDGTEQVIVSGLDTSAWPKNILEMVPLVQFGSLDEAQSFIDSTSELISEE